MILKGEEIKRLRIVKGWNETNLAHFAECRENTITYIEKGGSTSMKQANRIAKALKVQLDAISID